MTEQMSLTQKMVEVRKAYRLLHGYHKRLIDIGKLISEQFSSARYYQQELSSTPYTTRRNPFEKDYWAWDATPLISVSYLFTSGSNAKNADSVHKPGDYLLELSFVADSEYDDWESRAREADPSKFKSAEDARSTLSMLLIRCEQESRGLTWNKVWNLDDYPGKDRWSGQWGSPSYRGFYQTNPFDDLVDREGVIRTAAAFKKWALGA